MTAGRKLVEPRGYALVSFAATAMVVAGIGLAWTGLLLAAAGAVLSVIELKELQRLNPWLMPDNPEDSPLMDPMPRRIGWAGLLTTGLGSAAALAAAQTTGEPLLVLGPAAIAGATTLVFNAQMRRALEAGRTAPPPGDAPD